MEEYSGLKSTPDLEAVVADGIELLKWLKSSDPLKRPSPSPEGNRTRAPKQSGFQKAFIVKKLS